jgi:flagellar hook assembly protein FlgD
MYVGESLERYDAFFDGHLVIFDLKTGEIENYQISNDVEETDIWIWDTEYTWDTHDLHFNHTWVNDPVAYPALLGGGSLNHNSSTGDLDINGVFWQLPNSVHWLDESTIIARDQKGIFAINVVSGQKTYLDLNFHDSKYRGLEDQHNSSMSIAPGGGAIAYQHIALPDSPCYTGEYGNVENWLMGSYLNLTTDLRILKEDTAVLLKGTAVDLNFSHYALEYSDINEPGNWKAIAPPSESPLVDGEFLWWVPPHEGVFAVRLTVNDKAGNIKQRQEIVAWGQSSSVTGLYLSETIFSPNNDGIKDTVSLNYYVHEPVHLAFSIVDERGVLIKTLPKEHAVAGEAVVTWDGRDEQGEIVPDGIYLFKLHDYVFQVEVDNTMPQISAEFSRLGVNHEEELETSLSYGASDKNMKRWRIEKTSSDAQGEWQEFLGGDLSFEGEKVYNFAGPGVDQAVSNTFRLVAEDFAGNAIFVERVFVDEHLFLTGWEKVFPEERYWQNFTVEEVEIDTGYALITSPPAAIMVCDIVVGLNNTRIFETIRRPLQTISYQFSVDGEWYEGVSGYQPSESGEFELTWDVSTLDVTTMEKFRLHAVDVDGQEYFSTDVMVIPTCGPYISRPVKTCTGEGPALLHVEVREPLKRLRFQSGNYVFQDYHVIDAPEDISLFDTVSSVKFSWFPEDEDPEGTYIRVIAESQTGKLYVGEKIRLYDILTPIVEANCDNDNQECSPGDPNYPDCADDSDTTSTSESESALSVSYLGAESCNSPSTDVRLAARFSGTVIDENSRILGVSFDIYLGEQWKNIGFEPGVLLATRTIDTSSYQEGAYSARAVLKVEKYGEVNEYTVREPFVVSHTLPTAVILEPGEGSEACAVEVKNEYPKWHVEIDAITSDGISATYATLRLSQGVSTDLSSPTSFASLGSELPDTHAHGLAQLPSLDGNEFTARLTVLDHTNNQACDYKTFTVDFYSPKLGVQTDLKLFSPSPDVGGFPDQVTMTPSVDENVSLDITVFQDTTLVRTIAEKYAFPKDSTDLFRWNGRDGTGTVVADGLYTLRVTATDRCGHATTVEKEVEVDQTAPNVLVHSPVSSFFVNVIQEIRGEVQDPHFMGYKLWIENNGDILADQASLPVGDIWGTWNTADLSPGEWTIRLRTTDTVGNAAEMSVIVNIGERLTLIKDLVVTPRVISPDGNQIADVAVVDYVLGVQCDISLSLINEGGEEVVLSTETGKPAGPQKYEWDGKSHGVVVPDGVYQLKLQAVDSADATNSQDEGVSLIVDTIAPEVVLAQPVEGAVLKGDEDIAGTVTDANLKTYSLTLHLNDLVQVVGTDHLNRVDHTFANLSEFDEGEYVATLTGEDHGGNTKQIAASFVIDRAPPLLTFTAPEDGALFGPDTQSMPLRGTIEEEHLHEYVLRYGYGEEPAEWIIMASGTTVPDSDLLADWQITSDSGLTEGVYTISFLATDLAGWQSEIRKQIIIDATGPQLTFSNLLNGGYVTAPMAIEGTAADVNLQEFILELGAGSCDSAVKWVTLVRSENSVNQGQLVNWRLLPADGNYCLRLSGADSLGNSNQEQIDIKVDTTAPEPPVLSGDLNEALHAQLHWVKNPCPDISEYRLYLDGKLRATADADVVAYTDELGLDRAYHYHLTAVDQAGLESEPSNAVDIVKDTTPPRVEIFSPAPGSTVQSLVTLTGTVSGNDDLKEYRLLVGRGLSPESWQILRSSSVPVAANELGSWNTFGLPADEYYTIRLEAEDLVGNSARDEVVVTVDNDPPAAPVLLLAEDIDDNVTLTWVANQEADLAGYLIYRNFQLLNVDGPVSGTLLPYVATGTTYLDDGVSDGTQSYQIAAMDDAGNISGLSNALSVSLDNHPPQASIKSPADGYRFEGVLPVIATSPDTDIASVQFQVEKDGLWLDIGAPVVSSYYEVAVDPDGMSLNYGDYGLRAIATDLSGQVDENPVAITVTYTDVTPPARPQDLSARGNEGVVELSWAANVDDDFAGYNLYLLEDGVRLKLNDTLLVDSTFTHFGSSGDLADDLYSYELCTIDTSGNESRASRVDALVFTPILSGDLDLTIEQQYSVVGKMDVAADVKLFAQLGGESQLLASIASGPGGDFAGMVALNAGENLIVAQAVDQAGNISKKSASMLVIWDTPPAQPQGLQATEQNFTVSLSWQPNSDQDLAGYKVYRNNSRIQQPAYVATAQAIDVSGYHSVFFGLISFDGENAFDNDPNTAWIVNNSSDPYTFDWWEITFPQSELVTEISLDWGENYGAVDFEIQAWSGAAWLTLKKVSNNNESSVVLDFGFSYLTDKIRIYITKPEFTGDNGASVSLREVRIQKDVVVTEATFAEQVGEGVYHYKVSAVDKYGLESELSDYSQVQPATNDDQADQSSGNSLLSTATRFIYPAVSGGSIRLGRTGVDIVGKADQGTVVDLFSDDQGIGAATTSVDNEENADSLKINGSSSTRYPAKRFYVTYTADGQLLYYDNYNSSKGVWENCFYNRATEETGCIEWEDGWLSNISPNGKTLIFSADDEDDNWHLVQVDIETGEKRFLHESRGEDSIYEDNPNWSRDGSTLAYATCDPSTWDCGFILIDQNSGTEHSLKDVTAGDYAAPMLSPDAGKIAYFRYFSGGKELKVVDVSTEEVTGISDQFSTDIAYWLFDWAPDSKSIVYLAVVDGQVEIFVHDFTTEETTVIPFYDGIPKVVRYDADGRSLIVYTENVQPYSLWRVPLAAPEAAELLMTSDDVIKNLHVSGYGEILYLTDYELHSYNPAGQFIFPDVPLHSGENVFTARAKDDIGYTGEPSQSMTIIRDDSQFADLEVLIDDIFTYPYAPVLGDEIEIAVVARNNGPAVENVGIDIYLLDADGYLDLIDTQTIPSIGADEEALVETYFPSADYAGLNRVYVHIDPDNTILEARETNNEAYAPLFIASYQGFDLDVALAKTEVGEVEELPIALQLFNGEPKQEVTVAVRVEDAGGVPVLDFEAFTELLEYAELKENNLVWNTATTYAGTYQVRGQVFGADGSLLREEVVPFTIAPNDCLEAELFLTKTSFGPQEDVLLAGDMTNCGSNYNQPQLTARFIITDGTTELYRQVVDLPWLLADSKARVNGGWNTALHNPGDYTAQLEVVRDNEVRVTAVQSFTIEPIVKLSGSVKADPGVIFLGRPVNIDYAVANNGNAPADALELMVQVQDAQTGTLITEARESLSLAVSASHVQRLDLNASLFKLGSYTIMLQAERAGEITTLATDTLVVKDGTPPLVEPLSPMAAEIYNGPLSLAVNVTDNATGVKLVEYSLDGVSWLPLPAVTPGSTRYAKTWTPSEDDEGNRQVRFRATDGAGNVSAPVSVTFVVELKSPFEKLTGSLSVSPATVYQGQELRLPVIINNVSKQDLAGITARILISNPVDNSTVATLDKDVYLTALTTYPDSFTHSSLELATQEYRAILQVISPEEGSRDLANTSFVVRPSLAVETQVASPVNLLVWVNSSCQHHHHRHQEHEENAYSHEDDDHDDDKHHHRCTRVCFVTPECTADCPRLDLLEEILTASTSQYRLVFDRESFAVELRNPLFSDILILGDQNPLTGHFDEELREKVYSGTGLIVSGWQSHKFFDGHEQEDVLGLENMGTLTDHQQITVNTLASAITDPDSFTVEGKVAKVDALDDATVVAWANYQLSCPPTWGWAKKQDDHRTKTEQVPAIVLHSYGLGSTLYYGFELLANLDEARYPQLSVLLGRSLEHIHATSGDLAERYPYQLVEVERRVTSLSDLFSVEITETSSPELLLFDPEINQWVTDNPWTLTRDLDPETTLSLPFYVILPDQAGLLSTSTDVGFFVGSMYVPFANLLNEFDIGQDRSQLISDIIAEVQALPIDRKDRNNLRNVEKYLTEVASRTVLQAQDISKNIHDIEKAVNDLLRIDSMDIHQIRLQLDRLLRIEQGRFYFFVPPLDNITGTLTGPSQPLQRIDSGHFSYTLANNQDVHFDDLMVRLRLVETAGCWPQKDKEEIELPAFSDAQGGFMVKTWKAKAGTYEAVLEVGLDDDDHFRELARITFAIIE